MLVSFQVAEQGAHFLSRGRFDHDWQGRRKRLAADHP
jgi:hypothetical protein